MHRRFLTAIAAALFHASLFQPGTAQAADCPGNPDAIGVSRTIVVDPREHPRVGSFQYPETLPLKDKEVVLTLDDAPRPASAPALDVLAAHCVKATYFVIGKHARDYPDILKKIQAAGHTIGTHSQTHPLSFNRMAAARAEKQIHEGIASVRSVLGDEAEIAPFFRVPGLLRGETVESVAAARGLMVWSTDVMSHDWKRRITVDGIVRRTIDRLEAKGKGILLLHDIHAKTVEALPLIFKELKQRGYRIVHVQAATETRLATPTEPQDWQFQAPTTAVLPALLMSDLKNLNGNLAEQHAMSSVDFCGMPPKSKSASRLARRHARAHGRGQKASHRRTASARAATTDHATVAMP
ncbi:MAG: polysaccharide deacetylase family protein [Pseudorhodoplanes sp.]|jgi:peptidoglycan/xylan/chitin deacetylase (PgdA/CDA1 family)|nr:polysaccharide deacetylase family protein [Pseudorhodoplanes sp.]